MGDVDLMDQLKYVYQLENISSKYAYQLSKFRFYLQLFFDLLNIACVNTFTVYKKSENTELILKDFKLLIAEKMTGSFAIRKNSFPNSRLSKRSRKSLLGFDPPSHMPIFLGSARRCTVCSKKRLERNHP